MRDSYDEGIVFKKKYTHYPINDNNSKLILTYKDCSCIHLKNKHYLTKEIFIKKIQKY